VFTLPSESAPLMVLFDKGAHILKSADFHKEKKEWLYQLKNAAELADRADAVQALLKIQNDDEATAAIGYAVLNDKTWGLRTIAIEALGHINSPLSAKLLLEALDKSGASSPDGALLARYAIVTALGSSKDPAVVTKLDAIARDDSSYRARAAALEALGQLKPPSALQTLTAAVAADSPDDILRNAALRSMGHLGDDKAVPTLREWSALGKAMPSRTAAISSLGRLDKTDASITQLLTSYISESHFSVRIAAITALGSRGDATAIPALQTLLTSKDLSIEMVPIIKRQIAHLQNQSANKSARNSDDDDEPAATAAPAKAVADNNTRLERIEHLTEEMNDRLKAIESRLPPAKNQ